MGVVEDVETESFDDKALRSSFSINVIADNNCSSSTAKTILDDILNTHAMPPKAANYDPTGVEYYNIPEFKFTCGKVLHDVKVAYRSYNSSSTAGTILIPTCFSGWINTTLTFTAEPSDVLAKYHVVVAAMLGNGESSSPSNKQSFPEVGELHYEDVIRAHHHMLTDGLGIKELEAVIGFSMGGQQVYHWAVQFPKFVKRAVGICTSARTSPHNYAFLEGPIAAIINAGDYASWKEARHKAADGKDLDQKSDEMIPKKALIGFGRAYCAWITSAEWFRERHWKTTGGFENVEAYIQSQGEGKLGWNADDLLILARMWQMGNIGKTAKGEVSQLGCTMDDDDDLHEALSNISCPVLLLPSRSDQYFRPADNENEAKHLKNGKVEVIESIWGHAAGGGGNPKDTAFMGDKIKEFFEVTQ